MPDWAYFYLELGTRLATLPRESQRIVVGLAIPTRIFACSLVATGTALAGATVRTAISDEQMQYILNLKPGTSVHVRKNSTKLKGIVEKFEEYDGKPYIFIRTTKSLTCGFPLDDYALRITVANQEVSLPKNHQTGYLLETSSGFLNYCLNTKFAQKHIVESSFEALIVGNKSAIQREVCEVPFFCKSAEKSTVETGFLQEILRVRQLSTSNEAYHTQLVSSSNVTPKNEIESQIPPIVIFDGAVAYMKLGYEWRSSHHIVLLDRTERQFAEAIESLNQNYSYRLEGEFEFPIKIPDGIDMTIYWEGIQ